MHCDIHQLPALTPRQLAAWRELAAAAIVPNPFAEPEVVMTAAQRLDAAGTGLLVVEDGSGWLAAVPVRCTRGWRGVPGRWLTVWRHRYCYLGTPLLAPGRSDAALHALLRRASSEPGTGAFALEWVDAEGAFGEALTSALGSMRRPPVIVDAFERASLVREPAGDYLQQTVSPRHRKELRRVTRLLAAQIGELSVRDHATDAWAALRFLELEQTGWKGRAGTAMARRPEHAGLFVDLCRAWERAGRLQLLALQSDDRIVAMKCNIRAGAGVFCFKIAYDETFARYSPGVQLELANVEAFHRGEAAWMDSCAAPDNAMINRLWAPRRRLQSLVMAAPGARGAVGHGTWKAACAGRDIRQRVRTRAA